jgi:hypothetical protein
MQSIQTLLCNLIHRRQPTQHILQRKLEFKRRVELVVCAEKGAADEEEGWSEGVDLVGWVSAKS